MRKEQHLTDLQIESIIRGEPAIVAKNRLIDLLLIESLTIFL